MEPRIREQEFGNLQGDEFKQFREEQKHIGRFWYRFPTGESGADVHDRVKSWWNESVLQVNQRVGYEPVDGLVVVTHGLTMRFVLMQLYNWSPTTFHSVWNAGNCNVYVLRKDLDKPGISPYVLDDVLGDMPKSSVSVTVGLRSGIEKTYLLHDYLSIPPPRTTRLEIMKEKLAQQHEDLNEQDIVSVRLVAFTSAGGASQSRTTTGRVRFSDLPSVPSTSTMIDSSEHPLPSQSGSKRGRKWVRPEQSCRFPNFSWPDDNESVDED
jgi:broad specificity phosphatase PhoE